MTPQLGSQPAHSTGVIRILNAEPLGYSPEAGSILRSVAEVVEAPLEKGDLLRQIADYDVLIVRLAHRVDRAVIDAGRRLKAIVTATTGLDHIDVDYARSRGIAVLSLQGETQFLQTICATAEHTWALLLAVARRIPDAFEDVKAGRWRRDAFRGLEICGRRLGIVGLGRVGLKVAQYGLAFGMPVAAYDPYAIRWPDEVERPPSLHALLKRSDALTLHVPLTHETSRLIGWEELSHLPEQAILVNTSRGEVVDEEALCKVLESGRLCAAAVDVVCNEQDDLLRQNGPLLQYARRSRNLIVTPHLGGAARESMRRTEIFMAQKLATFLTSLSAV